MGLSPLLVNTYRPYKKETETFINWLASTARATGKVDGLFVDETSKQEQPGAGRLKGKARKEAKKQATFPKPPKFQISVKSLTQLANAVVKDVRAEVPRSMISVLHDLIQNRKSCAAWYAANQTDADAIIAAQNEGHNHFISVLEGIRDILAQRLSKVNVHRSDPVEPVLSEVTNIFEHLELEETAEQESAPVRPTLKRPKTPSATYEIETIEEDINFAIYCFLKDATDIRIFLRRTWREFKQGKIALETAAITMNAGMRMIKTLDDEFRALLPRFAHHVKLTDYLLEGHRIEGDDRQGCEMEEFFKYQDGGQTLSMNAFLCLHVFDIIGMFLK